ncbi:kinase-like domain-containing protein [Armillaria mellea]|nr:kinase-like domain-containing protein [Armillaria mellea]
MGEGQDYWRKRCTKWMLALVKIHGILPTSFSCLDARSEGSTAVWGGGFADIWKGRMGDTLICIKVLRIFIDNGIEERARVIKNFCREALVWRNLKHPNVLPFLGVSTKLFVPSFCLISPWMENGNIMNFLAANPGHDRLVSIKEVASGMAYLHSLDLPIVHADIRGVNILVTDDYRCCLADFGLALAVEMQAPGSSALTLSGSIRWLAPEVLDIRLFDPKYITARDMYAFGCTVIEIYSGKPPFPHIRTDAAIIHEVLTNVCMGKTKPGMGGLGNVGEVVGRCLVMRAADRVGATEVVRMLEDLGQG